MIAHPCIVGRAYLSGGIVTLEFLRHLPCEACRATPRPALAVGTDPEMPVATSLRACGVGGCTEPAERCATHLQDRIAAEMKRNPPPVDVKSATPRVGRVVADDEMRGPAWRKAR